MSERAALDDTRVPEPWRVDDVARRRLDDPERLVDAAASLAALVTFARARDEAAPQP